MTEWLDERYISRDEHHKIVAYYKKLVARLYGEVRELRPQADARNIAALSENGKMPFQQPIRRSRQCEDGTNVIHVDFRRRR